MNRIDFRLLSRRLTALSLLAIFAVTLTSVAGCKDDDDMDDDMMDDMGSTSTQIDQNA